MGEEEKSDVSSDEVKDDTETSTDETEKEEKTDTA